MHPLGNADGTPATHDVASVASGTSRSPFCLLSGDQSWHVTVPVMVMTFVATTEKVLLTTK